MSTASTKNNKTTEWSIQKHLIAGRAHNAFQIYLHLSTLALEIGGRTKVPPGQKPPTI